MARNIWMSAEHIAGKCNVAADRQSREINTNTEWMLNPILLNKALGKLQAHPDVGMFASRLNKQFPRYISFRPDPGAYLVDAFSAQWTELNGYYFPPFSVIPKVLQKLEQDKATGIVVIPRWPTQVWYSMAMRMLISCPVLLQHSARLLMLPSHPQKVHPLHKKLDLLICHLSGKKLHASGLSQAASDIIMCAWRDGTEKQYQTYLSKWENYCNSKRISTVSATVAQWLNFLAELVKSGVGYSGVNTARSAISTTLVISDSATFGTHPLVKRFLKGVFEQKPSLPRYETICDVSQVLTRICSYPPAEDISLEKLTFKVVMLLALLTGQRTQTIHCLDVNHRDMSDKKCIFYLTSLQKHSRPGKHQKPIELEAFDQEPNLCVIRHLKAYVDKTSVLRSDTNSNQLLLSFQKPFKPVSKDTISRWIKNVLKDACIDTTKFGTHSTRAASTSAAAKAGTPPEVILESAGWSNCGTFAKFYRFLVRNRGVMCPPNLYLYISIFYSGQIYILFVPPYLFLCSFTVKY